MVLLIDLPVASRYHPGLDLNQGIILELRVTPTGVLPPLELATRLTQLRTARIRIGSRCLSSSRVRPTRLICGSRSHGEPRESGTTTAPFTDHGASRDTDKGTSRRRHPNTLLTLSSVSV